MSVPRDGLHVLVLTRAVSPHHGFGGLERHTGDLVTHLLAQGVRVTLVTRPSSSEASTMTALSGDERLTEHRVPYHRLPLHELPGATVIDRSTAYPWFGWRAGRLAAELVRRGGIHLVHGMGAASLGYAYAREADWFGTVPLVLNPHGMEEFGSTGRGLGTLKRFAYAPLRKAVRVCARAADRIIATDRVLVPTVLKHLHVSQSKVAVIPNAVDLEVIDRLSAPAARRAIRDRLGLSGEDALLVAVGRLEANKGFDYLIAALGHLAARPAGPLSAHGRWRLVLLGDGSERARLARAIASANLGERVLMPGRVNEDELHAWYDAATLFVHPTLYEGSSIVTLEAMAHRLAIVATTAGGLTDKVRSRVNGWLVAPGDADALARAIEDALADRRQLTSMGEQSRAIVEREFAWTAAITRLLDLYDEVLSGPAAGSVGRDIVSRP